MGRDTIQLETAVSTISPEYLLEFTSEYGIAEDLHPELPGPGDRIVDFPEGKIGVYTKFFEFANFRIPISQFLFDILGHYQIHLSQLSVIGAAKNWNNRFFWVDEKVFPTVFDWRIEALKDSMPTKGSYSVDDVVVLNTRRTPIQKQLEDLLCLVGLSRRYFLGDDVYPTFLNDDDLEIDLFNLVSAPNPGKVKTGTRARAAHEIPARASQEVPPAGETTTSGVVPELNLEREVSATGVQKNKGRRKRVLSETEANAPPKVLRTDHISVRPVPNTRGGKSLAAMEKGAGSTIPTPTPHEIPSDVIEPDPLSYMRPQVAPEQDATRFFEETAAAGDPDSDKSTSFTSLAGSSGGIYQPGWGVTNNCRLDTPEACQDLVDHSVPPGYFSELRHLPNSEFLAQYNMNLARQVAMGSQLRLRFEQEVRLRREATAKIASRDQRIQAREGEIKRLDEEVKSLKAVEAKAKNADLNQELESLRGQIANLQLNNSQLSQQVCTLQAQVTGEEQIKAAFEEFKRYEDERISVRCAEMDARLDALSIDFDEELYPHMLMAIAGRRWVIGHGLRLAVLKCAESLELRQAFADVVSAGITKGFCDGLKLGAEQGESKLDLATIEGYDPEAESKFIVTMQALKDLKYPLIDELEKLKDAPMDVLMTSLFLESDTGEDTPQWIRDLRPSSTQLKVPVYPEVRNPQDPWVVKEEILLGDAIAANVSRAEKKKKSRVVCRTHGIGSAHHARSDGVPVSMPTVVPQGLAILLVDVATQTDMSEENLSPKLIRSKSLPSMYNLDWI
ncbi:hypothetical protein Tco_0541229 [Tanacetum coccineum]